MRNRQVCSWIASLLFAALAGGYLLAAPVGSKLPGHLFARGMDGTPVVAVNPVDGTEWAAWAYRNGSEFDLALAYREGNSLWSEPILIGQDDRLDQVDPAIAIDEYGNLYVLFAVQPTGQVRFGILAAGTGRIIGPITASLTGQQAGSPALAIVGESVIIAYHSADGTTIRHLPLHVPDWNLVKGIQEGPDAIDPLGVTPTDSEATGGDSEDEGTGLFRTDRDTSGNHKSIGPAQKRR